MKHIGEILREVSIPRSASTVNISISRDSFRCPICKDAGYLRRDYPLGHPRFGQPEKCECREKNEYSVMQSELVKNSNLMSMQNKTFESFDRFALGVEEAFEAAYVFGHGSPDKPWLFLHGGYGSGKTHLAAAIGIAMLESGTAVRFCVVPDLLDHLRATFDPQFGVAYDELFQTVKDVGVLILDDIGTENATPWAREKLFQIVNHRYNDRLPTVFTSNQDLKSRSQRYIDERLLSRMKDTRLSRYVEIDAEDFRQRREVPSFPDRSGPDR